MSQAYEKLSTAIEEYVVGHEDRGLARVTAEDYVEDGEELGRLALTMPADERETYIENMTEDLGSEQAIVAASARYFLEGK